MIKTNLEHSRAELELLNLRVISMSEFEKQSLAWFMSAKITAD